MITLDTKRPCNSRTRARDRYTRKEIEQFAKTLGIQEIAKKTMDELCTEVRKHVQNKKKEKSKTPIPEVVEATIKPKNTNSKIPCIIDFERPCNVLSKIHPKDRPKAYTLKQLRDLWKRECHDLPVFKDRKPRGIVDYCTLLRERYGDLMFIPIGKVPPLVLSRLRSWIKKVTFPKEIPAKKTIRFKFFTSPPPPENYRMRQMTLSLTCFGSEPFQLQEAKTNPQYLWNKNVIRYPKTWVQQQVDYIGSLPLEDQFRVKGYTFAGDKILNSFLLGKMDVSQIVTGGFIGTYSYQRKFPLAFDIFEYIRTFPTEEAFLNTACVENTKIPVPEFASLIDPTATFWYNYKHVLSVIKTLASSFKKTVWQQWIENYSRHLTRIIQGSPPVLKDGLFVYRGIKNSDFVHVDDQRNAFVNSLYMSTSLSLCTALNFTNISRTCCLFVLQVLPGTRCLFVPPLSHYFQECEVLFAPGRELFMTRKQAPASNYNKILVTHFAVVN